MENLMPEYKNTSTDIIPDWYLEWCWENKELQAHWKAEWEEDGKILSNIHPGDRFSLGKQRKFGLICNKVPWLDPSANNHGTHRYEIDGAIAAYTRCPTHDIFAETGFLWIPTAEQLLVLGGYHDKVAELISYIGNRSDPALLIEEYLKIAELGADSDERGDDTIKRLCLQRTDQCNQIMTLCGISIDEAEDPVAAMKNEGTEAYFFFHVRIDGKSWKMIDCRTGEWSIWQ